MMYYCYGLWIQPIGFKGADTKRYRQRSCQCCCALDSFPLASEASTRKGIATETTLQHPWEFNSKRHVEVLEEQHYHQELAQGMEGCCQSGFVDQLCYC